MIQTRSTIQKLLRKFTTSELLNHVAWELEEHANHYRVVGAINAATDTDKQAVIVRNAAQKLAKLPYVGALVTFKVK
jgi:hypothetical protein